MSSFLLFLLTIGVGFIGLIPTGLINSAVMLRSIESGISKAMLLSTGAILILTAHIFIATFLVDLLLSNEKVFDVLKIVSILLFLCIAIYFYIIRHKSIGETKKYSFKSPFVEGLAISNLNFLGVPYWVLYGGWLESNGWVYSAFEELSIILPGAIIGSYSALFIYAYGGKWLNERIGWFREKIYLILSLIFFSLALLTFMQML